MKWVALRGDDGDQARVVFLISGSAPGSAAYFIITIIISPQLLPLARLKVEVMKNEGMNNNLGSVD